jgi:hypothetical protein
MSLSADGEREIFASTADRARFSPRASSSRRSAIVKADRLLEFYFSSASEKLLHRAMSEKLVLPDFSHTKPRQLRELAATVRRYDQKMDERRMLTSVIEEHFKAEELGDWADKLDVEVRTYFTSPQLLFGETFTLDFNPPQIASSIASRIYHVRNALVHNKEAESARFVPFSGQEKALYREAPLILFLAEQLIIKTGKDLT